uniref:Odorant binding protein 2 n=1 Tax=Dendroctonus ponderosae TaxID=77166 RepID=A0A0H3W5N4_DENPD|nr:odorant binding protein 2 [Dendroctonus ponderosae]
MKQLVMVVLTALCVVHCKGLECGLSKISSEHFRKIASECVKDNETLNRIWELTSETSMEEDSVSSDEEVPVTKGREAPNFHDLGSSAHRNMKMSGASRTKRSRKGFNNESPMSNVQKKSSPASTTTEHTTTMQSEENEENAAANNVEESGEVCILQCIFEKLEMTDTNGLPDHKKVASALVKSASGRETQDFLQDSVDECFQETEEGDFENSCEYSTKLVTCLAGKGKSNCADWPVGDLPF